jgi:outer membrane beta-barrel protein
MSRALPAFFTLSALVFAPLARAASSSPSGQGQQAEAGDTSLIDREDRGPLKQKIPPVSGHFFVRQNRFELTPSLGLSFKDPFFAKYILSAALTYHATESVGIMLRGGYALTTVGGAAQSCVTSTTSGGGSTVTCTPPTFQQLDGVAPGQIKTLIELNLEWAPLYGKLSLISEKVAHFDLYGIVGPAFVQYGGPRAAGQTVSTPTWAVGGDVGVGIHFFLNSWLTLKAELRDVIYQENVADAPGSTTTSGSTRNQLMFDLGLSFFLPLHVEEG